MTLLLQQINTLLADDMHLDVMLIDDTLMICTWLKHALWYAGKTLKQQAEALASSHIYILIHGAAMALFLFLPKHAAIIEVPSILIMTFAISKCCLSVCTLYLCCFCGLILCICVLCMFGEFVFCSALVFTTQMMT